VECAGQPCALAPAAVPSETPFAAVAAGEFHTCALAHDGSVHCWGWNSAGEVGTGDAPGRIYALPARVHGARTFREISAHSRHSCAVTEAGSALCWGRSATGESGAGGWAPTELAGELTFRAISTGNLYTCATSADARTACFGDQAGLSFSRSPRILATPPFTRVGVGFRHSCGVASTGVWCWGDGSYGQLGPEAPSGYHPEPVRVPLPR
jgi:hypothetical protein